MTTLGIMKRVGVTVYNVIPLKFETEGVIDRKTWKPIKGSKPIKNAIRKES